MRRTLFAVGVLVAACLSSAAVAASTAEYPDVSIAASVDVAPDAFALAMPAPIAAEAMLAADLVAPLTPLQAHTPSSPIKVAAAPPAWRSCTETAPRPHADLNDMKSQRLISAVFKPPAPAVSRVLSI